MIRILPFLVVLFLAGTTFAANETINDQTDLAATPATDDKFVLWDTSTGLTKKVDYSYLTEIVNVDAYGGLSSAVSSIGATAKTVLVSTAQTVSDDLTIPSTLQIVGLRSGSVSVSAGKTLTINGALLIPDNFQFFSGAGTTTINSPGIVQGAWTGGSALAGLVKDEDDMASNSAAHLVTEQSVKAYVDATLSQSGFARGWVRANAGGSTLDSYNVSSIVDVGPGRLTVNWDTDFSSSNYAVSCSVLRSSGAAYIAFVYDQSAGSVSVGSNDTGGAYQDPDYYSVISFGDQ